MSTLISLKRYVEFSKRVRVMADFRFPSYVLLTHHYPHVELLSMIDRRSTISLTRDTPACLEKMRSTGLTS